MRGRCPGSVFGCGCAEISSGGGVSHDDWLGIENSSLIRFLRGWYVSGMSGSRILDEIWLMILHPMAQFRMRFQKFNKQMRLKHVYPCSCATTTTTNSRSVSGNVPFPVRLLHIRMHFASVEWESSTVVAYRSAAAWQTEEHGNPLLQALLLLPLLDSAEQSPSLAHHSAPIRIDKSEWAQSALLLHQILVSQDTLR